MGLCISSCKKDEDDSNNIDDNYEGKDILPESIERTTKNKTRIPKFVPHDKK